MMRSLMVAALVVLLPIAATGQGRMPRGPGPGGMGGPPMGPPGLEVVGFDGIDPKQTVTGAPFRAEATTEVRQVLADGNRIERRTTSTIARDSSGRVRREQPLPPLGPLGVAPDVTMITISDPVQRVQYLLDPRQKTAMRMPAMGGPGGPRTGGPPPGEPSRERRPDRPEVRTEALGSRTIAGLFAEGTRSTLTIPAGAVGNANAIEVVTERWYSPELQVVVSSHRRDPLSGEVVFNMVSLTRGEPSTDLFEIPSDYTVTERRPGRPREPR